MDDEIDPRDFRFTFLPASCVANLQRAGQAAPAAQNRDICRRAASVADRVPLDLEYEFYRRRRLGPKNRFRPAQLRDGTDDDRDGCATPARRARRVGIADGAGDLALGVMFAAGNEARKFDLPLPNASTRSRSSATSERSPGSPSRAGATIRADRRDLGGALARCARAWKAGPASPADRPRQAAWKRRAPREPAEPDRWFRKGRAIALHSPTLSRCGAGAQGAKRRYLLRRPTARPQSE